MVGRDGEGSQTETAPSIAVMEGAVARCLRALLGRASHARKLPTDNAVESSAKEEEAGAVHENQPMGVFSPVNSECFVELRDKCASALGLTGENGH